MAGGLVGLIEDGLGALGSAADDVFQFTMDITGLGALWDWIMPDMPEIEYPGVKLNKVGTDLPLPLVYGTRRLGGIVVFKAVDPTNTGNLHMVIALAEGEVSSIGDIYLNDDLATDPKFAGLVTITPYTGTTTQGADPDLVATFPDYTSSAQLKGVAYLHVKLTYNRDVFRGIPIITVDVTGPLVFSFFDASQQPSSNPARALGDYLMNASYGKGLMIADLDWSSFAVAENACDALIPAYTGGPNIKTFEVNAVVNTSRPVSDNITALLAQCRGNLIFTGGKYRLEIEGNKASSFSLDATNIISHSGLKSGGKRSRLNGVKVEFTNPLTDWEKDYAITSSVTMLAEDGGLVLETTVNRPFETSPYRAQYIAETIVKKSRESLALSLVASHQAMKVEVTDIVDVTHESFGWVSKLFRVSAVEIRPNLTVGLGLIEYEPTTYDRTIPASAFVSPPNTSLADPTSVATPTGLTISSGTNHLLTMGDGSVISRAKLTWNVSADPYFDHFEVQGSKAPSGSWSEVPPITTTTTAAYMGSVQDGQAYTFRVRAVNTAGVPSAWLTSAQHTVLGKQQAPDVPINVAYATTVDGRRRLTWQMPAIEADLTGFQIRYFSGASGNWNTATDLHAGLVSIDPNIPINTDFSYEFDHLSAGSYAFFIRPWDTSGLTSIAAASVTGVTLPEPPGGGATWGVDITGQPADSSVLNNQQQWADVGGPGTPSDNATAGATWGLDIGGTNLPANNADVTQTVMDTGILTTGAVWMNSGTFGQSGVQIEYNGGNPRLHIGDGTNNFLKYDGTLLTWKAANTELDAAGKLVASNVSVSGTIQTANGSGQRIVMDSLFNHLQAHDTNDAVFAGIGSAQSLGFGGWTAAVFGDTRNDVSGSMVGVVGLSINTPGVFGVTTQTSGQVGGVEGWVGADTTTATSFSSGQAGVFGRSSALAALTCGVKGEAQTPGTAGLVAYMAYLGMQNTTNSCHLHLVPQFFLTGAPTHAALKGSFIVNQNGDLYYNKSGGATWIQLA